MNMMNRSRCSLNLPDHLWKKLHETAEEEGVSLDSLIESILEKWSLSKIRRQKKHLDIEMPLDAYLLDDALFGTNHEQSELRPSVPHNVNSEPVSPRGGEPDSLSFEKIHARNSGAVDGLLFGFVPHKG